jgi:hypothetical protein
MTRLVLLVSAMYAVAAMFWLVAHTVQLQARRPRLYRMSEFVGKSAAQFAMGLTVAVLLVLLFRLVGIFPPSGG